MWVLYVPFVIDYIARLKLADQRTRWFFQPGNLLDLVIILLPFLRPLRYYDWSFWSKCCRGCSEMPSGAASSATRPSARCCSFMGFPSNREGFPLCCGRLVCSESLVLDRRHQCGGAVSASGVVESWHEGTTTWRAWAFVVK